MAMEARWTFLPVIHYNAMQIFGADRIERLMKSPQLPSMN